MKVVVVGLGSIGMRHARNLRQLDIHSIFGVDPNEERRAGFSRELGSVAYTTLAEALEQKIDLAIIASPNRYHIDQSIEAATMGCHLFIEKPLGTSLTGLDELIGLIDAKKLFAHVGSNWKFQSAFRKMKLLIADGALGRITGVQVLAGQWLPDWHPWEDYRQMYSARKELGGGVVFDTHEIDYMTWLVGAVREVRGISINSGSLEIETNDVLGAVLAFKNGAIGTLHADYIQRQTRRRYHLSGDKGTIEWDLNEDAVCWYDAETKNSERFETPLGDVNEMYLAQMQHVLDGVSNGVSPVTSVEYARQVLECQTKLASQNHA